MAYYNDPRFLQQSSDPAFSTALHASSTTPHSGIYRCVGCGDNAVSTYGHPLPPQNHHQHTTAQGRIRWQLIVATN